MIIGNGQLASRFRDIKASDVVIFASGVADSNCIKESEFKREKDLLISTLLKYGANKKFIYFSSCALSSLDYPKNRYYQHKLEMEEIIKQYSENHYIFRIPQLLGRIKQHETIINYFYDSIINDRHFFVFDKAYRYVIDINDVYMISSKYIELDNSNITVDLANPYAYKVINIVNIIEEITKIHGNYTMVDKCDCYKLDLSNMLQFVKANRIPVTFSESYLKDKLKILIDIKYLETKIDE